MDRALDSDHVGTLMMPHDADSGEGNFHHSLTRSRLHTEINDVCNRLVYIKYVVFQSFDAYIQLRWVPVHVLTL